MSATDERLIRRFSPFDRALHVALMLSFLALSISGLPLLFADLRWARSLSAVMGGYGGSGAVHRLAAALMIACFVTHLARVTWRALGRRERGVLWGPDSLVPQPRDAVQMFEHFRWFLHLGPRPHFGRYTYWEKFDYWAVFWGMGIIGISGLVMWQPWLIASWLPGWIFNVALIVHGEEAMLAMVFIFTVHFFNGHLRPEKFPMDPVIFTGTTTIAELRHERPAEYEALVAAGKLDQAAAATERAPRWVRRGGRTLGTVAVALGWMVVVLTIIGLLR